MMYHAESFADNGFETYIVGYRGMRRCKESSRPPVLKRLTAGSKPTPALLSNPHVQFFYLSQVPQFLSHLPFMITAPIKIIYQVLAIFTTLLFTIPDTSEFIIAQVGILYLHRPSLADCRRTRPASRPS